MHDLPTQVQTLYTSLWACGTAAEPDAMSEARIMSPETLAREGAEASALAADRGGNKTPSRSSPSAVTERQIPVDPASLRRLGMVADEDSPLSLPSVLTEVVVQSSSPTLPPLRRPTFVVGASLPCSAASSPAHGGARPGAAPCATHHRHSPTSVLRSLARQHSAAALAHLVVAAAPPSTLSRSASRAEGRTMAPHDDDDEAPPPVVQQHKTLAGAAEPDGSGFTCGALCMPLFPGFSKKKPAAFAGTTAVLSMQRQQSGLRPRRSSASRVASLERFECGSWSPPPPPSPPPPAQHDAAGEWHAMEVAKTSCCADDDAEAPVKMAFVFDGEAPTRGILKNSASSRLESARPSTSSASQRHVRFSSTAVAVDADAESSCPTSPCITPRLARARAEFHAFLEAQSA